ncbi:MAG TPA: VOC family protein [Anaerolineales bacterium]|nr:VOC family protein [Anaerolineales bacterium]
MSIFKNVNVVSIDVTDWEAAKKFYGEVLDWPVAYSDDQIGWYEYGRENETHVSINRRTDESPAPAMPGGVTIVFTVDDADQAAAALRAKGVKCDDPVNIPGVVKYGTFYDPEGNRLQFASAPS